MLTKQQPKNPLFQKCITYLESLPNLKAKATIQGEPYCSSKVLADGLLIINTPHTTANYVCAIKTGITYELVEQVAEYFILLGKKLNLGQRPLLITRHLSNLVVEQLLEKNIEFIDIEGNIYLNSPEIYIVVRNQVFKDSKYQSLEITPAALQVIYALLTQPKLISPEIGFADDSFHEIAYISGITLKTVKSTLKKLQELDYIRYKFRRYEIVDYVKLLERWELGYSETLRARLLLGKFSSIGKRTFSQLEAVLQESAYLYDYLIGGELAASIITEHLRPLGATLHLDEKYKSQVAMMLRLKPDSAEGNIVFMKRFGNEKQHFENHLVHPLLIHAELVCSGNSRLKETAQIIYDKYIKL